MNSVVEMRANVGWTQRDKRLSLMQGRLSARWNATAETIGGGNQGEKE
jgi:hypothetical protein